MAARRNNGPVVRRGLKATDQATGRFEGYLAVFGNVDDGGDVIDRGAFAKTIAEAQTRTSQRNKPYLWPILWQHDSDEPIGGYLSAKEDSTGLYVTGQLDLDIEKGRTAYSALAKGYIDGLSIGYDAVKSTWTAGARHLTELRLWEGSVVTFPMNELAAVGAVKGRKLTPHERNLERSAAARRRDRFAVSVASKRTPLDERLDARMKRIGAMVKVLSAQADLEKRLDRLEYHASRERTRYFAADVKRLTAQQVPPIYQ